MTIGGIQFNTPAKGWKGMDGFDCFFAIYWAVDVGLFLIFAHRFPQLRYLFRGEAGFVFLLLLNRLGWWGV